MQSACFISHSRRTDKPQNKASVVPSQPGIHFSELPLSPEPLDENRGQRKCDKLYVHLHGRTSLPFVPLESFASHTLAASCQKKKVHVLKWTVLFL